MNAVPVKVLPTGQLAVEIANADGEVFDYEVTRLAPDLWRLARVGGGKPYQVRRLGPARWKCDCPDDRYRNRAHRSRLPGEPCKHCEAIRDLLPVLDALAALSPPTPRIAT